MLELLKSLVFAVIRASPVVMAIILGTGLPVLVKYSTSFLVLVKKTSPDKIIDSLNARLVGHFLFLNFLLFLRILFLIYLTKVSNNCWENSELAVILTPT